MITIESFSNPYPTRPWSSPVCWFLADETLAPKKRPHVLLLNVSFRSFRRCGEIGGSSHQHQQPSPHQRSFPLAPVVSDRQQTVGRSCGPGTHGEKSRTAANELCKFNPILSRHKTNDQIINNHHAVPAVISPGRTRAEWPGGRERERLGLIFLPDAGVRIGGKQIKQMHTQRQYMAERLFAKILLTGTGTNF